MDARSLIVSYLSSFETGDVNAIAAHVGEGFVNEHASALGTGSIGHNAYLARLPGFLASMPGLRYEVEGVLGDGDEVVAFYVLHSEGGVHVRGCMHVWVTNGLIARRCDYWDSLSYLRQTGQA